MYRLLLVALCISTIGCRGVNRLLGQDKHDSIPVQSINPDDYYIAGTTTKDHQSVYLAISSRTLTVEIQRPGEAWQTLERVDPPYNPYGTFTMPQEGIYFGDRAEKDANGNIHYYTGTPSAPTGTQYRIHSVKA